MLNRVLAVAALMAFTAPALAQTATPPVASAPAATAPALPTAAPDLTKDGKPRMKVVRQQCREEVKGGGLKGEARKQAMADCIVKQRPDMEARIKCQMDPSLKGLDKGAKRAAVKACVAKSKS